MPRTPPDTTHKPTDESRAEVSLLAGFGVRQEEVATYIGISHVTLRKHYRKELDTGHIHANAAVARSLYNQALDGNIAAAIFWLKSRAGWKEKPEDTTGTPQDAAREIRIAIRQIDDIEHGKTD